jgi:hypothetical protein
MGREMLIFWGLGVRRVLYSRLWERDTILTS